MSSVINVGGVVKARQGTSYNVIGHEVHVKKSSAGTNGGSFTFELVTAPGVPGPPPHIHEHEDELIVVVSGEFDVLIDGEVTRAKAGDVMDFARGTAHTFTQVGNEPGVTVWTVTPGASFEAFFEELGALPAGPPDPAVLVPLFARYGMTILAP